VRNSACPDGARKITFVDSRFPGFLLEVRRSGGKTFYQRYRDSHGRERQFKIGPAHVLTVAEARRKAREVRAEAILGADPQQLRQELRAIPTLRDFIHESYLPHVQNAKRSWKTDETLLRLHILPRLGSKPIDGISSRDVADLLRRLKGAGYSAGTTNRVLVLLRFAYNLAKKWRLRGADQNPTAGLKTDPDVQRERFLSAEEARALLAAIDVDENKVAGNAIKLLLLCGGRRNEVSHAKWEFIDWQRKTLLVPVAKNGQPRLIQLNSAAVELLRSIQREDRNPYIFPSPITGRPSASLYFPWSRIRNRAGLQGVRLHDLRHSFASFLINEGVSLYVVQHLLGHAQARTTQRYAHLANETLCKAAEIAGEVILPNERTATGGEPARVRKPASPSPP
jgi:integrase